MNRIKNKLLDDLHRNISILGFLKNYTAKNIYEQGNSYIITGKSDHLWAYISSESKKELDILMNKFNYETKYFASIEKWMKEIICKNNDIEWQLTTKRFIFSDSKKIKQSDRQIRKLNKIDAKYIYDNTNYKKFTSKKYIEEQINNGVSAGIEDGGKLIAWGLSHDDNALGFLHVLPEYRRKGYAEDISRYLILQKQKQGDPVFLNVEVDNIKSLNLIKKMGFIYDREISWLKLK